MGDRAVMDDRHLIAAPVFHMAVHGVPAGVHHPIAVPLIKVVTQIEQRLAGGLIPVDSLGRFHPEPFRVLLPAFIDVTVCHGILLRSFKNVLRRSGRCGKRLGALRGRLSHNLCRYLPSGSANFCKPPAGYRSDVKFPAFCKSANSCGAKWRQQAGGIRGV